MSIVRCDFCGVETDSAETRGICRECGRDLPAPLDFDVPTYPSIQRQVSPEQEKARKQASSILFGIAGLQFVCGLVGALLAPQLLGIQVDVGILLAIAWGIGLIYAALGWWSLRQPLPASIVGLILYIAIWILDILGDPERGFKGAIIKIIIIGMLIQAVSAASKANVSRSAEE